MCQVIFNSIPTKWHTRITKFKVDEASFSSLASLLSFLLHVIPEDESSQQIMTIYMKKFCEIFEDQFVIRDFDPIESRNQAFSETELHIVISEFLGAVESIAGIIGLEVALANLFQSTNKLQQTDGIQDLIHEGYALAIKSSKIPLIFVKSSCQSCASPERMSALCEIGLTSYVAGNFNGWNDVQPFLIIPELDESMFIKHCLSHCFAFTLYAHALKKMQSLTSEEYRTIIGEQIGVWIETLNVEAASVNEEYKILLVLHLFSKILSDSGRKQSDEVNSRLSVHLLPIADSLFKWSEKHHVPSLWSALGYSSAKGLPSNIRLICRYFSIFIASRMLKTKDWTAEYNSFAKDSDFAPSSAFLEEKIRPRFLDQGIRIKQFQHELYHLINHYYGSRITKLLD